MELYTHMQHIPHTRNRSISKKIKFKRVTWRTKETKSNINQLKTKPTKTQSRKQDQSRVSTVE